MKKIISKIIILFLTLIPLHNDIFAQSFLDQYFFNLFGNQTFINAPPPCGTGWGWSYMDRLPSLAVMGDSRSLQLAAAEQLGSPDENVNLYKVISYAHLVDGTTIFSKSDNTKAVDYINTMNLGWFGATVTDDWKFPRLPWDNSVGRQNYNRYWDHCNGYILPDKLVLNLSGNDMVNHYQFVANFERYYLFFKYLTNPIALLQTLSSEKQSLLEKELFWLWMYDLKEEEILWRMKEFTNKMYAKNPHQNFIILDIAPGFFIHWFPDKAPYIEWENSLRLNVHLSRLNRKIFNRLVPDMNSTHGPRVHSLDVFNSFLKNLTDTRNLTNGKSYYVDEKGFGDGIHFTLTGVKAMGKIVAAKMALAGWFPINSVIANDPNAMGILNDLANDIPVDLTPAVDSDSCDTVCLALWCLYLGICSI